MIRCCFFDLDGTLADTEPDIKGAWRATISDLKLPLDAFEKRFVTGPSIDEVTRLMYPDLFTPALAEEIRVRFGSHYDNDGFPTTREYPGVLDVVRRVRFSGIRVAVATNKRYVAVVKMARKFGWDRVFDGLYAGDMHKDDPIGKLRKPELLALICRETGIAPGDCVMIGDTCNDFEAAKANGMCSVGVAWGYGTPSECEAADCVVSTAEELATVLLSL